MQFGRSVLYTDVAEVNQYNISDVLRSVMPEHETNANDIQFLLEYDAGLQKKFNIKKFRPDIDNWCVDNVAAEISNFWLSYGWGNPITLSMREQSNEANKDIVDGVFELNKFYSILGNKAKNQELANYVVKTGIGYTFVDINTEYEDGGAPFIVEVLDPSCTFVVRSTYYIDKRVILAGTYFCDKNGNKTFTCYTRDTRYDISSNYEDITYIGENPLGVIPIIEWFRAYDRMGVFEREISEMNNLNLLVSSFTNDVEQNTNCVWHTNDVEFPKKIIKDEEGKEQEVQTTLKGNDLVQTYTTQDGKTPIIEALSIDYDYEGMLNNIITRRALILQKCNVPSRNDNSGGSTGVAMSDATGWSQAEAEANRQDQIKDTCKINEVKVVLRAIAKCNGFSIDNPVRKLKYSDVEANIPRQKTYELTTKVNAICALIGKGFSLEDTLTIAPLFEDNNQVLVRSGEGVRLYQENNVFKTETVSETEEKRPFPDYSDEESQSPVIGGRTTGQTE